MAYQGRVGIVGIYQEKPFAGFVLSSRREPDRNLVIEEPKNRVWVGPGEKLRAKIAEKPFEAVDDLYACLIGFHDQQENPVAVSFNGRMSNRVKAMMQVGEPAQSALMQILPVFPPIAHDPRISAIASVNNTGKPSFYFGVYDRTNEPYVSVQKVPIEKNHAKFITLTDCRNVQEVELRDAATLDELSLQLFDSILGIPAEFGCGAAVCLVDGNVFKFGAYNGGNNERR